MKSIVPKMLLLYNVSWNSKLNITSPHHMYLRDKLECAIWHTRFKSGIDLHDSEWLWRTELSVMDVEPYCKSPGRKNIVFFFITPKDFMLLDSWWWVLDQCLILRDTFLCLHLAIGEVFIKAPIFRTSF